MATISKRNDTYRSVIRKKGIDLSATFTNEEDAILWSNYKEYIIDMMDAFDPPLKEMITLRDALELKINRLKEQRIDKKTLSDYTILLSFFEEFCSKNIIDISQNDLLKHFDKKLKEPIILGGNKNIEGSGKKKLPSSTTIFRKFAYLSTIYEMLIKDGVDIENVAIKVCKFYREKK